MNGDELKLAGIESMRAMLARDDGREAIKQAQEAVARAAREVAIFLDRYNAAESEADKARVLNSVVGYLATGILPNARLDMLADAQARLTVVAEKRAMRPAPVKLPPDFDAPPVRLRIGDSVITRDGRRGTVEYQIYEGQSTVVQLAAGDDERPRAKTFRTMDLRKIAE